MMDQVACSYILRVSDNGCAQQGVSAQKLSPQVDAKLSAATKICLQPATDIEVASIIL